MNTKHFKVSEFKCKCGKCETKLDKELLSVLELVRLRFGQPVIITSGYRCPTHNANVGGASKSKHMEGIAADIKVKNTSPDTVYAYLDEIYPTSYGVGLYKSWVHIDVRPNKARWGK